MNKKKKITHKYERIALVTGCTYGGFDDITENHLTFQWPLRFSEAELGNMIGKNVIVTIEVME